MSFSGFSVMLVLLKNSVCFWVGTCLFPLFIYLQRSNILGYCPANLEKYCCVGLQEVNIYFFILIPVQPMKAVSRIHLLPYQLTEFVWSNRMLNSIEANCLRWDTSSVEFCKICWFVSFLYNREH